MMSAPAVGPITRRILTSILKSQKVVDLTAQRQGQHETERSFRETVPSDDCGASAPASAAYAFVTNCALGLVNGPRRSAGLGARHIDADDRSGSAVRLATASQPEAST